MSEADFFAPPNTSNTKPKEEKKKDVDEDGYTHYWDDEAQQYYYWDEVSNQSYYYDDQTGPAYKNQKRRNKEKKASEASEAQQQAFGGAGGDLPSMDPDVSEEEEAAARVRKLEKRLRKRREAAVDAAREARKAQRAANGENGGFWSDDEDDKFRTGVKKNKKNLADVLNMDLSVSEEEEGPDGTTRKRNKKRRGMDPEEAALVDELEAAEAQLAAIKYAKKEAEKKAAQNAADKERAKIQKSAQSLASLFAKFGIDDGDDDYVSPTAKKGGGAGAVFGPAGAAKAAKEAKKAKEATYFESGVPPLSSPPTSAPRQAEPLSYPSYPAHPQPDVYTQPYQASASPVTSKLSPAAPASSKLTPAQALSEKRRLAAFAKAAEGVGGSAPTASAPKSGGSLKIQISCPHCGNYNATIPLAEAAKATQCPSCKQYFVPQQQLAATFNAAGSKAGGAAKGATIVRGAGDRCKCGKAKKGSCFLCGE
eukprot:GILI01024211.1.p1 GENE.GILI01024211.1~~GILI01024211.1.p1  ORF type:complete len:534 (+),score=155.63 GILI01024211.1:163-1602(+)